MDIFYKFLPLLVVFWGSYNPGSGWIKEMNEARNKILDEKCSFSFAHKQLLFRDWQGFFGSFIGFQFLLTAVSTCIASLLVYKQESVILIVAYYGLASLLLYRIYLNIKAFWLTDKKHIEAYFESHKPQDDSTTNS